MLVEKALVELCVLVETTGTRARAAPAPANASHTSRSYLNLSRSVFEGWQPGGLGRRFAVLSVPALLTRQFDATVWERADKLRLNFMFEYEVLYEINAKLLSWKPCFVIDFIS